jgi:hypothetical protein
LSEPVSTPAVLALLSRLVPETVALTQIAVEMSSLPEPGTIGEKPPATPVKPAERRPIRIGLTGVARTDADVARCVTRLSEHALFANVKLARSRQVLDGGPPRVSFNIMLEIPVNRKFIVDEKEVAHAG